MDFGNEVISNEGSENHLVSLCDTHVNDNAGMQKSKVQKEQEAGTKKMGSWALKAEKNHSIHDLYLKIETLR